MRRDSRAPCAPRASTSATRTSRRISPRPEFFDVERTPEISFVDRDLRVGDDGALTLDGELTLRGQTREVEAKGELSGPNDGMDGLSRLGLSLEATIDRTAFGLKWNAPLPKGGVVLANDVKLLVELELVQQD